MVSLLDLIPNNILRLKGRSYRLLEIAGEGGHSIVYLSRPLDNESSDYVMIKEFFPRGFDIKRIEQGTKKGMLLIPPSKQNEFDNLKSWVLRESEIIKKLRDDRLRGFDNDKSNSGYFFPCSNPIAENNTLYTIIATESGEMLSKKIKRGVFADFISVCNCVLKILEALQQMHKAGFLHLDVSPDNIHFSDTGIARLIDYNSAFRIGDNQMNRNKTKKIGYSAEELTHVSRTKAVTLGYETDTYSVAAIFFRLLINRMPEEDDWDKRSKWLLNSEEGYLMGASKLLVKKTNDFLSRALKIQEKELGSKHPDTIATYNNIAMAHLNQKDFTKAIIWLHIALDSHEKILGENCFDTAVVYNNMASAYDGQGEYRKALEWYSKSLSIYEEVLDEEHLSFIVIFNNIAFANYSLGNAFKALKFFRKALHISKKSLGIEHPTTLLINERVEFICKAMNITA